MKLVIHPPVGEPRLGRIIAAAAPMTVVDCTTEAQAVEEIRDADALFGYLTPPLLVAARQLLWVQSPTASMEK